MNDQTCRYPEYRKELVDLVEEDQKEIRSIYQKFNKIKSEKLRNKTIDEIVKHNHARARRMMEILDKIKEPTVKNIGLDGSGAMPVLALHSYLGTMEKVLDIYQRCFKKDRKSVYAQSIPSLIDRITIIKSRQQIFGTNWYSNKNGKPFLIAIEDFSKMNQRRAKYGLDPARKPVNLAKGAEKYPLGKGLAKQSDQKQLTEQEYNEYSKDHL